MPSPSSVATPVMPLARSLSPTADRLLTGLLAVFGFVLPWSTAAVSVGMGLLVVFAAWHAPAAWRTAPWRDPVVAAGLALLAWITLHTAVVSGLDRERIGVINQYHELLIGAVLLALYRLAARPQWFIWGLALGTVGYAVAHWVALAVPELKAYLQPRYISAGFILATTAFVLMDLSFRSRALARTLRAAALFLAATVVFTIEGRTGQLVLAGLAAYAAWVWAPRRWRLPMALVVATLLLALAFTFGLARDRMIESWKAFQGHSDWVSASTGIRLGMLASAANLASEHALAGVGYARLPEFQERSARRLAESDPDLKAEALPWLRSDNLHNEYLMQLLSGGVVALVLFLGWLVLPALRRRRGRPVPALVAVSLAFAVGCLFNSMLQDFVEGHFYMALLAWLLARNPPRGAPAGTPA